MAQDPGRGTMILVLGIVSIVCCPLVGPLAWIWGKQDLAKIRGNEIAAEAEQMTKIGMILGIVGTVLLVLNVLIGCVWGIILALAAMAGSKKAALDVFDAVALLLS